MAPVYRSLRLISRPCDRCRISYLVYCRWPGTSWAGLGDSPGLVTSYNHAEGECNDEANGGPFNDEHGQLDDGGQQVY